MSNLIKKEKGFTLIEIVLVLAIAGLLLVIVFLAVQGAQRSRRDSQRQQDAARMLSAIEACAANNSGAYGPCDTTAELITAPNNYFNPATVVGGAGNYSAGGGAASVTNFNVTVGNECNGTARATAVAVRVGQEAGAAYCVNN